MYKLIKKYLEVLTRICSCLYISEARVFLGYMQLFHISNKLEGFQFSLEIHSLIIDQEFSAPAV